MGTPLLFTEEFELVIMIAVAIEEMLLTRAPSVVHLFSCGRSECGAQIFRLSSELIENPGKSGSPANGRNSAITSRSDTRNSDGSRSLGPEYN